MRRPWPLFLAIGTATAMLAGAFWLRPTPRLVWNASASTPRGLYRILPGRLPGIGDWVVVRTPAPVRALAAARHYLPSNVPLVKRVAAIPGQRICGRGAALSVDGIVVAHRRHVDPSGRLLPWWEGCRLLDAREYLVLGVARDSFDGRYFGPVTAGDIVGKAVPLWVR